MTRIGQENNVERMPFHLEIRNGSSLKGLWRLKYKQLNQNYILIALKVQHYQTEDKSFDKTPII